MTIYLQTQEVYEETKTVIKKRVPSHGDGLFGLKPYVVHTMADVHLKDFRTIRDARQYCSNPDKVAITQLMMIIGRLVRIYWSGVRDLRNDTFIHQVEADLENYKEDNDAATPLGLSSV